MGLCNLLLSLTILERRLVVLTKLFENLSVALVTLMADKNLEKLIPLRKSLTFFSLLMCSLYSCNMIILHLI